MLQQANPGSIESFLVRLLDSFPEVESLDCLKKGYLRSGLLSPAIVQGLMDSELKLLSYDQAALQGLFVGVEGYPKLFAVGDAIALLLDVEDNGVTMVLVLGQARRDELHELTVLLPDFTKNLLQSHQPSRIAPS